MNIHLPSPGQVFGLWTIVKLEGYRRRHPVILCRCHCGVEKVTWWYNLRSGRSKSCGCLSKKLAAQRHTHNESHTFLYRVWACKKYTCQSKGTKFYEPWRVSYIHFRDWSLLHGYEKGLYLRRIDDLGDYDPDNCVWVPSKTKVNESKTKAQ